MKKEFLVYRGPYFLDKTINVSLGEDIKHIKIFKDGKIYTDKDLEILDILKTIIKSAYILKNHDIDIGYICSTIDTNKILREWLDK